ncbi:MAG: metal ABC transporter substrate-binding protein, partial [Planctomycetota bacterium]|nr:metal ABC transporter substrate-binding protein [Planctomycetota bacterium]
MRLFISCLTVLLALTGTRATARELSVVATIPDLADLAKEIGGERVTVTSIAKGTMNVHAVPLKPSTLIAVSRADLFLQMGLSLEHAYAPGLLQRSRNPRIQPGTTGFVNCSEGWEPLDVPESLSRSRGTDLHPLGNPHFNLDPRGGKHIADHILSALVRSDPAGAKYYGDRYALWLKAYQAAMTRWTKLTKRLRGTKLVTYHRDFTYFLRFHGIEQVDSLEAKPGVPPKPKDLLRLIERIKSEEIGVILTALWSNNKSVRFVAEKTGATIVEAPIMVGGV